MKRWQPGMGFCVSLLLATLLSALPPTTFLHAALSQIQVTSPADSGRGTLRQALLDANAGDRITFSPVTFPPGNPVTIFVQSALPTLDKDNVTIDASDAGVIIDGSQSAAGTSGLTIEADNCVIRGLTVQHFPKDGIFIAAGATGNIIGGSNASPGGTCSGECNLIIFNEASGISIRGNANLVRGNYVGIDRSGWYTSSNALNGVAIWEGATGNIIGGTTSGYRNMISGNGQNGVWICGTGTNQNEVIGNYVGTRADGMGPVPNGFSGVAIQSGAQRNHIGGTTSGAGNLISGNSHSGIYLSDPGTNDNQILGNIIGPNWQGSGVVGQGDQGVVITEGASGNKIGDGSENGRNTISSNSSQGVLIRGSDTVSNTVQGNYIGTNTDGDARLANGEEGIRIDDSAHNNRVEGNVISGNGNGGYGNGIVIVGRAHDNVVSGNLIGTDKTGAFAIGGQPGGGVDLAGGAYRNIIGGPTAADRNVISGNGVDGVFIEGWETVSNTVQGNYIGTDVSGIMAIPNNLWGLFILNGAAGTTITSNLISHNASYGMQVTYGALSSEIISNTISQNGGAGIHFTEGASLYQVINNTITGNSEDGVRIEDGCAQITLARNSIYNNGSRGIRLKGTANGALPTPELTVVTTDTITGTTVPNARVEFFSDDEDEGRVYEGFAVADAGGTFSFALSGGFVGPNVAATTTDASGNTSEFSQPVHLLWTLLLYLNGDNDLDEFMFNTLTNTVAAGPSPRANVLMLVDGYTTTMAYSDTMLYDVTRGEATPLSATQVTTGERNMGDGQTLVDFVTWGQSHYPTRYTLVAIVDHGGGWAPGDEAFPSDIPALARHRHWSAGSNGLSWDFTSDHDYLDSEEIRQAMATITNGGTDPLDVVFYDVCLMGMLEVAYQIKDHASFFVSSQNIGWAPVGPEGRYIQTIQGIDPTATPRQMAELLVQAYANATPPNGHPFTISAVDLSSLSTVASTMDQLAIAISQTLTNSEQTALLHTVYSETQKLDYDSDFRIEPATDGFVDLYDFALHASQQHTDVNVSAEAQALMAELDVAIVAEEHRSGRPWLALDRVWGLDDAHGLSIFLPLGEDLELPILITETSTITPGLVLTRNLRLRDTYSDDQLQFVADTSWGALINTYYEVISSPVPAGTTEGPVPGLLTPDVTPPRTTITATGTFAVGEAITITWVATDSQTGVDGATLWHRPPHGQWTAVLTQTGSSGTFSFTFTTLSEACMNKFAVRAFDNAGNVESLDSGLNMIFVNVQGCQYLPLVCRRYP
jgi:hypothetical protein